MHLKDAVVFIIGANRGLGLAYAQGALAAGAKKVYIASRDPASITLVGVHRIKLDVTDSAQIEAAVKACADVTAAHQQRRHFAQHRLYGCGWPAGRAGDQLLLPVVAGQGVCARARGQWWRRHRQCAVRSELNQLSGHRHLQRDEVGRLVDDQRAAQRVARPGHAGRRRACGPYMDTATWPGRCRARNPRRPPWSGRPEPRCKPMRPKCWPMP